MSAPARSAAFAFAAAFAPAVGAQSDAVSGGIGSIDLSSMVLSLGVVVAIIVGAAFVLKRTPFGFNARASGPLELVATLPLGPRERLILVTMRGREILVGVSPAGVAIAPVDSVGMPAAGAAGLAREFGEAGTR